MNSIKSFSDQLAQSIHYANQARVVWFRCQINLPASEQIQDTEWINRMKNIKHETYYFVVIQVILPLTDNQLTNESEWHTWGIVPVLVVVQNKGLVRRKDCIPLESKPQPPLMQPTPNLDQPSNEFNLEQARTMINRRIAQYRMLSDANDKSNYVAHPYDQATYMLMLVAVARDPLARATFVRHETKLSFNRLLKCSDPYRAIGKCVGKFYTEAETKTVHCFLPFEQCCEMLSILREYNIDGLKNGLLTAPAIYWLQSALRHIEAHHQLCVETMARQPRFPADHPLRLVCCDALKSVQEIGTTIEATTVSHTNQKLDQLEKSMPPCMRQLHERAQGMVMYSSHLKFEERSEYYRFVLASGVGTEQLIDLQSSSTLTRLGLTEGNKYIKTTLQLEGKATAKWISTLDKTKYVGTSCKTLGSKGMCPYATNGRTTGQAQNSCEQWRSAVLKREETQKPSGTPLLFSQSLHAQLQTLTIKKE